jgi:hypothetical protein
MILYNDVAGKCLKKNKNNDDFCYDIFISNIYESF